MIGIHDRPGGFSDRWVQYCAEKAIPFRRVNCLATDVIAQCEGLDALLWHWSHIAPADLLVARQVIAALQLKGLLVYPNVATCWHFDDKIAQKYLLEAIGAPLIPTWVFTNKVEAMRWISSAAWPKVLKLRCGAGSTNVKLACSKAEAAAMCRQAFGRGFPAVSGYLSDIQTRVRKARGAKQFWRKVRHAPRTIMKLLALRRQMPRQQGYLYFQEFLPNNPFDTRIIIIGDRAFGHLRMNRPNDFRASGSGNPCYEHDRIDKCCVQTAFRVTDRLLSQSLTFDFLFNPQHQPMISEISYCTYNWLVHGCEGYWDRQGVWHEGHVWPEDAILEDVLAAGRQRVQGASGPLWHA